MSTERIPMTREGYEKLKADLDRMQNVEMLQVAKRIAAAREHGDLSENAEYHAAREDQGMLQARIDSLKDKLSRAYFVDRNNQASDAVIFGARVQVKDLDLGEEEIFELVGAGEEDYNNNKILITSPIGQGLVGKKCGDVAEIAQLVAPSPDSSRTENQQLPAGQDFVLVEKDAIYRLRVGVNTVGRLLDNDVVIPDPYLSRRHCAILIHATKASEIYDVAS